MIILWYNSASRGYGQNGHPLWRISEVVVFLQVVTGRRLVGALVSQGVSATPNENMCWFATR
jgi:hypothetical protein